MKLELTSEEDISLLAETCILECKLAQGEDGTGAVPKDFWKTYSAMANTDGGTVLLGVREKSGQFSVAGVEDVEKVKRDLFNSLNNPGKVSVNLLNEAAVETLQIAGKNIVAIHIPQASRSQRPVFLNGQPLLNTWRRLHDGDRLCDAETVKRMLVEQVESERDRRLLVNYGIADLEPESVRVFRQMLRDHSPAHPWLELDDIKFLQMLGVLRRDRESGAEGVTLAGLLMFGSWPALQEAVPHYLVDYQERPEARTEARWVDRVVPDGTWSGNVFDFFRRVYRKLVADLKVPFAVKDGMRQDDTPVHVALREALVNTLVHADYTGLVSVLVVKRPDMFGFRNPGRLRLPLEQVLQGGESDCRNRLMHQMFLMIGLGERAGSGMPKILSGWTSQHWRQPLLREKSDPEQTLLELHMADLLPDSVVQLLRSTFGLAFDSLDHGERLIMATAVIESTVNHGRLIEICDIHPHDLSLKLAKLEREGLLQSYGQSKAKMYYLPGGKPVSPEDVFPSSSIIRSLKLENGKIIVQLMDGSLVHNSGSLVHNVESLTHMASSLAHKKGKRDQHGCLMSELLESPLVDHLESLSAELREELQARAQIAKSKPRMQPEQMRAIILDVCRGRYIRLSVLGELLGRNPNALRRSHMDELVKTDQILRAFPHTPNHEMQSYKTKD